MQLTPHNTLPADADQAALLGRIWRPEVQGPSVVTVRHGQVLDISARYPTTRDVFEANNPAAALRSFTKSSTVEELLGGLSEYRSRLLC